MESAEKLRSILRNVMYCALTVFILSAIYQIVSETVNGKQKNLCNSAFFLIACFFNQFCNGFFIFIGYKMYKSV